MHTVVVAVLQGSATHVGLWWHVLGNYFWLQDEHDCDYDTKVSNWVHKILATMVSDPTNNMSDEYGSEDLKRISLWEEDFDKKDKGASAYTSHEDHPRMHIGPSGFLPAWVHLGKTPADKCASLGDEVSEKMLLFATLVVHELTYVNLLTSILPALVNQATRLLRRSPKAKGGKELKWRTDTSLICSHAKTIMNTLHEEFSQCPWGSTMDIQTTTGVMYGPYRTRQLMSQAAYGHVTKSMDVCNADNYAWFVTELYWSITCGRTFGHPSQDETKGPGGMWEQ
ncbi:hypothetical protein N7492_008080 [Penicillium capsulatum]|uniref:Uncharacterized protein n=1 Tax=Penicillium capsulatum TaxID=69766 RepID=A0A9W9LGQ9_9EURO|nr:hypothetical protein N7492_008080 [Penicillium capsulatum]KAJ6105490.1 hypothetical protein N7512_009007 [Penicillium capsulatum]